MEKEQYMLLDRGVEEGRYLSKNKLKRSSC